MFVSVNGAERKNQNIVTTCNKLIRIQGTDLDQG